MAGCWISSIPWECQDVNHRSTRKKTFWQFTIGESGGQIGRFHFSSTEFSIAVKYERAPINVRSWVQFDVSSLTGGVELCVCLKSKHISGLVTQVYQVLFQF